jgi:hypothetical protein
VENVTVLPGTDIPLIEESRMILISANVDFVDFLPGTSNRQITLSDA